MNRIDKVARLQRIHILSDSMPEVEYMPITMAKLSLDASHLLLDASGRSIQHGRIHVAL